MDLRQGQAGKSGMPASWRGLRIMKNTWVMPFYRKHIRKTILQRKGGRMQANCSSSMSATVWNPSSPNRFTTPYRRERRQDGPLQSRRNPGAGQRPAESISPDMPWQMSWYVRNADIISGGLSGQTVRAIKYRCGGAPAVWSMGHNIAIIPPRYWNGTYRKVS